MMINKEKSFLLSINLQKHLIPMIQDAQNFIDANILLLKVMNKLEVPTLLTLHKGLGDPLDELKDLASEDRFEEKTFFSCLTDPKVSQKLKQFDPNSHVIISGMEAHACVMQTAIDHKESTKMSVFVVEDAITSRSANDKEIAIRRMQQLGINIISKEMVFFEFSRRTDNDIYKYIMEIVFKKA